jgi:hypothetical protein
MFVDLLTLGIASALGPAQILLDTLLLLSPDRGVSKAGSFVAGMTVVRLIQGILFGFVLGGAAYALSNRGQHNVIASTLLLVLGITLLTAAYEQWRTEEDPDGSQPRWLTMIDSLTPVKAFGIGFAMVAMNPTLWFLTLNAIADIGGAQLNRQNGIIAFLLFMLLAEALVLLPILIRILLPEQSTEFLDSVSAWLVKHNRVLVIAISLMFGLYFLVKGITNLLA